MGQTNRAGRSIVVGALATTLIATPAAMAAADEEHSGNDRAGADMAASALPLGSPQLPEHRTTTWLSRGVSLTRITRGEPNKQDEWTITVTIDGAVINGHDQARHLADQLRAGGFVARVDKIDNPEYHDQPRGPLGWRVRVGHFPTKDDARSTSTKLDDAGFSSKVVWTGEDAKSSSGPWRINVLKIKRPRLPSVRATYGTAIAKAETTSAMSQADGAVAAINAGYFATNERDGFAGEPSGLGVYHGIMNSEASNGRAALVLSRDRARIAPMSSHIRVRSSDGATRHIDGIDRKPGIIHLCGGVGGDEPTTRPRHPGPNCTDDNELILDNDALGSSTADGKGIEAVLDQHHRVVKLRKRGGSVPAGGQVLQGTGNAAHWLRKHATPGHRLHITSHLTDHKHREVPVARRTSVVGGGPMLVRHGHRFIDARAEGDSADDAPYFVYSFGMRRNPRTMAGVDGDGNLLLVTADGRQPGYSIGLNFTEQAKVMRALGARSAMNLDGGGSTTMVARNELIGQPSGSAERAVGDALEVLPR